MWILIEAFSTFWKSTCVPRSLLSELKKNKV